MTSRPSAGPAGSPASADTRARRLLRRIAGFLSVAAVVLAADQWSKALVRARLEYGETWPPGWELIRFTHVENTGAAFGILQGMGGALMVIALLLVAGLTFVLLTQAWITRWYTLALSAILGGAVGNLVDRVRLGAVTDFIDPTHYPAFNIADSAIVCGVGAIILLTWLAPEHADPAPDASEARS
ncbi:MAG: signal peptidase II [Dehalococcoidia bacterium]